MTRTKSGLTALGLCALVVSLMAITASSAQAKGDWTYLDASKALKIFTTANGAELQGNLETGVTGVMHYKTTGGTEVLLLCTSLELVPTPKLLETGATTAFKAKFTGCKTDLNKVESKNCEPKSEGGPKGTIKTKSLVGLIILHEGIPAILVEPLVGTELVTAELGELCSIGENVPITGEVTLEDCLGKATTHLLEHLFEPANLEGELRALGQLATLLGSGLARLVGTFAGREWAFLHLN